MHYRMIRLFLRRGSWVRSLHNRLVRSMFARLVMRLNVCTVLLVLMRLMLVHLYSISGVDEIKYFYSITGVDEVNV